MKQLDEAAAELVDIYDEYFRISNVLRCDLDRILDDPRIGEVWRRNLVRTSWPMLEAYAHTLRDLCRVLVKHSQIELSRKQKKLLDHEKKFDSLYRLKETSKIAFSIHELDYIPDFGGTDWENVVVANSVRDNVTHPKCVSHLVIENSEWERVHAGLLWLMRNFTEFFIQVNQKYGSGPQQNSAMNIRSMPAEDSTNAVVKRTTLKQASTFWRWIVYSFSTVLWCLLAYWYWFKARGDPYWLAATVLSPPFFFGLMSQFQLFERSAAKGGKNSGPFWAALTAFLLISENLNGP